MKKKLLATAVTGALVAAQLGMTAMAAGGQLDVTVTTKSAVLRVVVPTKMEIAVDEFESGGAGSQIYSEAFTMQNRSAVDVKVDVTSTATASATLVGSASEADDDNEAWLAAVAQTADGVYGADLGALSSANSNVATFDSGTKKATQTFYLGKGTGELGYHILITEGSYNPATDLTVSYAEFYELADGTGTITNTSTLQSAVDAGDVYYTVTGDSVQNGASLTLIPKGTNPAGEYAGTNTYYTVDTTPKAGSATEANKKYVYAGQQTVAEDGKAAFRYIGKLSETKTGGWSASDISQISIAYEITGIAASSYEEKKENCTYGLYTTPAAPSIAKTEYKVEDDVDLAADWEIEVELGAGKLGAKGIKSVKWLSEELVNSDNDAVLKDGKIILAEGIAKYMVDHELLPATFTVTFDMNDPAATPVTVDVKLVAKD